MILNMEPQFFMINALTELNSKECLSSFFQTSGLNLRHDDIHIVKERETREITLNHILNIRDTSRDLFVFVDDIRFKEGWWQALQEATEVGDIIGFSMTDPRTQLLQDFGYDIVKIDSQLTYQGLYKHYDPNSLNLPPYRECSSVCGCAMWIRSDVLNAVGKFPLEGKNRWGELLFCAQAKKLGYQTVVTSQHLEHYGTSTKQKTDKKLSSLSWLIERDLWEKVAQKFFYRDRNNPDYF